MRANPKVVHTRYVSKVSSNKPCFHSVLGALEVNPV